MLPRIMMRSPATILFLAFLLAQSALAADLFVGPAGNDSNPGTRSKPFATLERARDAVRQVRAQSVLGKAGATVWVLPGDYFRTNALQLSREDSGTSNSPVVWRAQKLHTARLLGGIVLTNFTHVAEPAILARFPAAARDHIREVDLTSLSSIGVGEMKSRGFARPLTPAHCELFFAGRPLTLARWPNAGAWATIEGFPASGSQGDEHGGQLGALKGGFIYAGDRPRNWQKSDDTWVHGYWAWDWANSYERLASIDLEHKLLVTAPPQGLYGFRKGQRFYFLNVLEELDEPGEWFLDRAALRLYLWPPENLDKARRLPEILLSVSSSPLLELKDASHVTFQGFTLESTRGSAVEIDGGAESRISECIIRNIGNYGVIIQRGTNHGVVGCTVFDTGDGGVMLEAGDRQTLTPGGHFVESCHFARQGRWSKCYVPAVLMNGVGLRASRNLIHDHPHCAILFNGNDHIVELNEIHHIALETGDVGAIYTGRDYSYRGNIIRYNYVHHTGGVGMGSMGVYMDDCVSGTEIYGNVFYKVQRAAFLGGGRDHRVINNIFVDCNHAVELDGRGLDKSPVWHNMVDQTMRQRLREVPLPFYRERYPEMKSLDAYYGLPGGPEILSERFQGVPPENNVVENNICLGKWLNVAWHAKPEMLRLDNNLVDQDPGFIRALPENPKATDFYMKPSSPAWKLGFERIPLEQIGKAR